MRFRFNCATWELSKIPVVVTHQNFYRGQTQKFFLLLHNFAILHDSQSKHILVSFSEWSMCFEFFCFRLDSSWGRSKFLLSSIYLTRFPYFHVTLDSLVFNVSFSQTTLFIIHLCSILKLWSFGSSFPTTATTVRWGGQRTESKKKESKIMIDKLATNNWNCTFSSFIFIFAGNSS